MNVFDFVYKFLTLNCYFIALCVVTMCICSSVCLGTKYLSFLERKETKYSYGKLKFEEFFTEILNFTLVLSYFAYESTK